MAAQQYLKAALRTTVAPYLREHGFRGSATTTWVRKVANGDCALVRASSPKQYHGLWRERLNPGDVRAGKDVWWTVTDEHIERSLRYWPTRGRARS